MDLIKEKIRMTVSLMSALTLLKALYGQYMNVKHTFKIEITLTGQEGVPGKTKHHSALTQHPTEKGESSIHGYFISFPSNSKIGTTES